MLKIEYGNLKSIRNTDTYCPMIDEFLKMKGKWGKWTTQMWMLTTIRIMDPFYLSAYFLFLPYTLQFTFD